ncbi:hypothetical protein N5079_16645 [Planotetraspora sp. A-T 1434]|uniref:hypothetical protein n=1 Tax=Planotetraspora sp. A-T 1434 TaxID=2979219 RepID=UPI0021BEEC15|nr:hypothetical protein [Planotetraspora sp. A-T 1434]MCT9931841.1 hypothetical protein [Planotetraspora sp. A-T 1434]
MLLSAQPAHLAGAEFQLDLPVTGGEPAARLDLVMREFTHLTLEWEPQLRTSLRLSLEPGAGQPMLRQGRAIGWIEDALAPLRRTRPGLDVHQLAVAIRSATGIEALIWLTDIAGLSREQAAQTMRWSARAMLCAALAGNQPGKPFETDPDKSVGDS